MLTIIIHLYLSCHPFLVFFLSPDRPSSIIPSIMGTVWYFPFCVWLISLTMMISSSSQFPENGIISKQRHADTNRYVEKGNKIGDWEDKLTLLQSPEFWQICQRHTIVSRQLPQQMDIHKLNESRLLYPTFYICICIIYTENTNTYIYIYNSKWIGCLFLFVFPT